MVYEPINSLRVEYDTLKSKIKVYEEKYAEMIKEKPVEMAAAAFGIGILTGAILAYLARRK